MKQKGKYSVSAAIIEALKDTAKQCELNATAYVFDKRSLFARVKAYCGGGYVPDDEMIGRSMRKLRAKGKYNGKPTFRYTHKGNGIYIFEME